MGRQLCKVLCVEDDDDIRDLLSVALGDLGGLDVLIVPDAESGLAKAPTFAPDILLMDVMLPRMSGPDALPAFRAFFPKERMRIVFHTAKAGHAMRQELMSIGADEVLFKPFDPMELADKLRGLWAHWNP